MSRLRIQLLRAAIPCVVLACAADVRGEDRNNLAAALSYAGFDLVGQRNPLSGGIDFLATANFDGNPFDFGAADLTLSGPLSLQVSTGGRLLSQFDVSFTTAVNASSFVRPLSYAFNADIGPQSTQVTGAVLADVDFSLNGLGFYDLSISYSSEQTITSEGIFANGSETSEEDFGPIDVSGNIYADVLAILVDPIYDRAGTTNPFEQFSGAAQLSEILQADASDPGGTEAARVRYTAAEYGLRSGATVPEPAVLVLMLIGIPAIVLRRSTR